MRTAPAGSSRIPCIPATSLASRVSCRANPARRTGLALAEPLPDLYQLKELLASGKATALRQRIVQE
jgi:hypothetical protein